MAEDKHQKAAESHKEAAKHYEDAAYHHREAAKFYASGDHEKGAYHAHMAHGHHVLADQHEEAAATLGMMRPPP